MLTKPVWIIVLATTTTAMACMRPVIDRRAVQWSDAIVHAKLVSVDDKAKEIYSFEISDSMDGSLSASQKIVVHGVPSLPIAVPCPNQPTADDAGKSFVLLLRSAGKDSYEIVNVSPADMADTSSTDALKELIKETRKAESGLTDEAIKTQASAYADAQDDTEADQAEEALLTMGYKALPIIRNVLAGANEIGKQRLAGVVKELTPPTENPAATQP